MHKGCLLMVAVLLPWAIVAATCGNEDETETLAAAECRAL